MKKSVEILGLPIISITEGRELGVSKSLLIDAKNGLVAAITVEDNEWYRGVKLIPYEAVIAIGDDAVTITHSENILKLEEAGDYETMLEENVRVIGTKAISKNGVNQGNVTEIYVGDDGKIEQCEITAPDGTVTEFDADQISTFGKLVTMIDFNAEKKNDFVIPSAPVIGNSMFGSENAKPSYEPQEPPVYEEPAENFVETPQAEEPPAQEEMPPMFVETPAENQDVLESVMTPEPTQDFPPAEEIPAENNFVEEIPQEVNDIHEANEFPTLYPEHQEEVPQSFEEIPQVEEPQHFEEEIPATEEPQHFEEEIPVLAPEPEPEIPAPAEEPKTASAITKQAEALKAALKRAMEGAPKAAAAVQTQNATTPRVTPRRQTTERAVEDRRRMMLLGKKAARTIKADTGAIIVEAGAEITEEVLQKAKLANKFIDLSMNYIP